MSVDMWDQESGSDGTVSNAVRRYTAQWGLPPTYDEILDRLSSMLGRIKVLEEENTQLRRDLMDPPADIQELGDTIKVIVVLAFTDNNCKLANEIASLAEVQLNGAETYAMVKVCRESQAVFKNIVVPIQATKKGTK